MSTEFRQASSPGRIGKTGEKGNDRLILQTIGRGLFRAENAPLVWNDGRGHGQIQPTRRKQIQRFLKSKLDGSYGKGNGM